MKVDEKCPLCGTINKGLNLEETEGWFECEKCKQTVNNLNPKYAKVHKIPKYNIEDLVKVFNVK